MLKAKATMTCTIGQMAHGARLGGDVAGLRRAADDEGIVEEVSIVEARDGR